MRLLSYWDRLRSSFWFLPSLMTAASIALAYMCVAFDESLGRELPKGLRWAYTGGADGASAVLEAIAGSMITIAGVVFSLTLVALSLASSQFGPRLLRNFMRDTSNQFVIGTFIATFLYCLLVLRTIRYADETAFVPQVSVTVGVGLALLSMAVLIYFIHHVAVSIQADDIIARVIEELNEGIDRLYPEQLGKEAAAIESSAEALPIDFGARSSPICACADGYLQFVDGKELMSIATDAKLVLATEHRPGHYIVSGTALVFVYPSTASDDVKARVQDAFVLGHQRTAAQDVEFSINQLVEIAVRALSPGVNDPFTAVACIDRLGSALSRLAQRRIPSPYRRDAANQMRVYAPAPTFPALLDTAFDQIRQCGASSVAITIRLLETIAVIATFARRADDRAALQRQADMIVQAAAHESYQRGDRDDVKARYARVCEALSRGVERTRWTNSA